MDIWITVFFTIATVAPLFVSLIFLSASIRQWKSHGLSNIFISASLFVLAISMFMLWSGQTFEWYSWLARSFWSTYPLVIPFIFGFVLVYVSRPFHRLIQYVIAGVYTALLGALGVIYVRTVFTTDVDMASLQGVHDVILGNSWDGAIHYPVWVVGVWIAWLISCIWLWLHERDRIWLVLFSGGFIQLTMERLQASGTSVGNGFIVLLGIFIACMLVGSVSYGKRENH